MPTNKSPLNKKPEKKDYKQEFLDMVANQSGPLAAATMDQALKHQNTQLEEAMGQGGMTIADVSQVVGKQLSKPQNEGQTEGKKGNFWYQPFEMNQQTGQVTPASILGGLISQNPRDTLAMAQAQTLGRRATQESNLSPEEAASKVQAANEALQAQGLEGYEAKLTAKGDISVSKPSSYATASSKQSIEDDVEGIATGKLPPDLTKVVARRDLTTVAGKLAKRGLDLKQLALDYQAEQSFIKSINSTQQVRLRQLIPSVTQGIGELDNLNEEFKRTGVKAFNKATMEYYANGGGTKKQQELSQKFISQMTVLADEMGSIFMGGNTPTDRSLDMAQKLFRGDFNDTAVKAANEQVKRNLGYRANAIESVSAIGTKGLMKEDSIVGGNDISSMSDEELNKIAGGK